MLVSTATEPELIGKSDATTPDTAVVKVAVTVKAPLTLVDAVVNVGTGGS